MRSAAPAQRGEFSVPTPPAQIAWPSPQRQAAFEAWLQALVQAFGLLPGSLRPASADASFRRYLRIDTIAGSAHGPSLVLMDAPPPQEDVRPFVQVAGHLQAAGLSGARVLAADVAQGFLLLSDLGSRPYLDELLAAQQDQDSARAHALMRDAIRALVQWQSRIDAAALPPFDDALLQRELDLFPDWCVRAEHGLVWNAGEQAAWATVCQRLKASALAQPVVAVHADWMPRNLMCASPPAMNPGILDFQDAVAGPISYDLASLLRDAFISWDEELELDWAVRYWQQARAAGLPVDADFGEFWRATEWMGLQRHLKVLGIFCRLKHRDGKTRYVRDLPRFFHYATKVATRYGPLKPLLPLLQPMSGAMVAAGYTF